MPDRSKWTESISVGFQVIVDVARLPDATRRLIRHAHDSEVPGL